MTNIKIYTSASDFRKYNREHDLPIYNTKNIHTPLAGAVSLPDYTLNMKNITMCLSFIVSHNYHRIMNK